MSEKNELSEQSNEVKKKGRKPKQSNYFDVQEEMAVIDFLTAKTYEEKNKIYNDFLRKPLDRIAYPAVAVANVICVLFASTEVISAGIIML